MSPQQRNLSSVPDVIQLTLLPVTFYNITQSVSCVSPFISVLIFWLSVALLIVRCSVSYSLSCFLLRAKRSGIALFTTVSSVNRVVLGHSRCSLNVCWKNIYGLTLGRGDGPYDPSPVTLLNTWATLNQNTPVHSFQVTKASLGVFKKTANPLHIIRSFHLQSPPPLFPSCAWE